MKTSYKNTVLLTLMLALGSLGMQAQAIVINAPVPADNPNLPGYSPWPYICAGNGGFNEYFVNITWAGTANSGNQFILELSDANGNFSAPVTLATVSDKNNNNDFDIGFAIPTDIRGDGYRMRVRSTDPVKMGAESPAYSMYFMDVTYNLNISELGDGVPPGEVCATGPITLQVDNVPNPQTYQYIWYKSGTPVSGETGHTLYVTESGMYNAFIDYGNNCTGSGNTDSNIVDVTIGGSGSGVAIDPPSKTALCSTDTETLTINMTDPSWSYKWFKNGTPILGATGTSYTVDASNIGFEGEYAVEISGDAICTEMSAEIAITNADAYTVTRDNAANVVVLPSQSQTLSVSTTANAPSYKWFRNGTELGGENNSTLAIAQAGTYYAEVTQTGGTCGLTTKLSGETVAVAPVSFEIVIDHQDSYTDCVSTSTVLEVTTINALDSNGNKTNVTASLADAFSYQWQKDGNVISGQTGKTLSLASNAENGQYSLKATVDSYNESSNTLPVQLLTSENLLISSGSTVYCNGGDAVSISTDADLAQATFAWQKDGVVVNTTDAVLNITDTGKYRLVVERSGCELISNEVTISPLDENLITLDPAGDNLVIAEGTSKTVTARGGTGYRWLDASNNELSATDSISITEEGMYTLIASIDNCEVVRQLQVSYLDTFRVPNVITVNGDGINDQWILPNSYSNKADVNVIIYNAQGEEVFNEFNYKNNWPQTSTAFTKQNMVFYYKIRNASEVLKQGTITVIR